MIKRCILHILEHGTVPAVALALAIAPTNSRSWQRQDLTEPTKRMTKILFSEPRADGASGPKTPIPIERTVRDRAFHLLNALIQSHQALFKIGEGVPGFFCLCTWLSTGLFRSLRCRRNYRFCFFPRLAGGGRCSRYSQQLSRFANRR